MKKTPFHDLPICPAIIADCVLSEPYTQALTNEQRNAFVMECEKRCFEAYKSGAEWFSEIIQSRGNTGRDKLHLFTRHWLAAFISNIS